jgi:putative ABC transport system permease protein
VLICGALPSLSLSRMDLNESLKKVSSGTPPRSTQKIRNAFICAQVSLAFVLLVGSGLLVRSLWQIFAAGPGVDAGHLLALHVYWPNAPSNSADNEKRNALFEELMLRLRGLPSVTSVAATSNVFFPDEMYKVPFVIEDQAAQASGERPFLPHGEATPDYFRTMGIPLLKGRFFDQNDALKTAVPVVIINETMARRYWQGGDPLGKRFRLDDPNFKSPWFTIIGVVGNVRQEGLEKSPGLMAYLASSGDWSDDLAIRTKMDPRTLVPAVREQVRSLDKNLAIDHVHSVSDLLALHEYQRKFNALLLGALALVALLLAAMGIYGTISYWVRQRTQEIGVRMALGARRVHIFGLVMRQGLFLVFVGLLFGIGIGLAVARLIASLLYGVSAYDPITFIAIAALVVVVAFVACYLPALRAVKVDPLEALRYE